MACFTVVRVKLDNSAINRKARKALGLPLEGDLSAYDARRVGVEAKILTSLAAVRRLQPSAVIKRKGDKLTVQVQV